MTAFAIAGCPSPTVTDTGPGPDDAGPRDGGPTDVPATDVPTADVPAADTPGAACGDGVVNGSDECDDGDTTGGDGCSATCTVETGWDCTGEPSVCDTTCGDGEIGAPDEACDDTNTAAGDGCSDTCQVESGWDCSSGTCTPVCGDGTVLGGEACDDANTANGDGCSAMCAVEPGWDCTSGTCLAVCGDGMTVGAEVCDDMNTATETACAYGTASCMACDATCAMVLTLTGNVCGDGAVDAMNETCDDTNTTAGDGCSASCQTETGWDCSSGTCAPICGDGMMLGAEACDDGNTDTETACPYGTASCTGCDATCGAALTLTGNVCGDGVVDAMNEGCDDDWLANGDGCSSTCTVETGFTCTGAPLSRCGFDAIYAGPGVAVPDNGAAVSVPILVTPPAGSSCVVLDVSTTHRWEPNHTFLQDLILDVVAPTGTVVTLSNRPTVRNSQNLDGPYTFSTGGASWPPPAAPGDTTNTIIPAGTYGANYTPFAGISAAGTWAFRADDNAGADTGSVSEFAITFVCDPRPPVVILADCFDGAGPVDSHRGTTCHNLSAGASVVASYSDFPAPGITNVEYFLNTGCTGPTFAGAAEVNFCGQSYSDASSMNDRLGSYRITY